MQREDLEPWYRQFWPWFIMALPAFAVVAGLYTVWLSMQTTDSLVIRADDGVNAVSARNTAAEKEAARLGLAAIIRIQADSGAVVVTLSARGELTPPDTLLLHLRHPTMATRDAAVDLVRAMPNADGSPSWAGHFLKPPTGRYYLSLASGDAWRLSGEWSGQSELRLAAADLPANDEH